MTSTTQRLSQLVLIGMAAAAFPLSTFVERGPGGEVARGLGSETQQPSSCNVHLDSAGRGVSNTISNGMQRWYGNGGVFMHCVGQQTSMRADSAAWYQDLDRVDFIGRVHFLDPSVTLDADRASYHLKAEELDAFLHVQLLNRRTHSKLQGTNLIYKRAAPGIRDTSELLSRERPVVDYHSEKDTVGQEPYVIIGSVVFMKGDAAAWASGDVTINRSDFHAASDSASLDLNAGVGHLVGHSHVLGKDSVYQLSGRNIDYRLKDRKLTWAQARGLAEAVSDEWHVTSDTMQFNFGGDRIQSGNAWGDSTRPKAVSVDQSVSADSLVIDAPNQALKELRGIRRARATSRDSSMIGDPNWMAGDTVTAHFDSTAQGKRYLAHLNASGHAQAFYCVVSEKKTSPPGYNYSRGRDIAADLTPEGMQAVYVSGGNVDGVYLEPVVAPPKKADSLTVVARPDSLNIKKAC
ncbi:MAG TPA: hypothetical protein VGI83_07920 [Gemmatimonadales bacterium]